RDLAITIDDGEGISQIDFTLTYDSEILDVQDILVNPDLAGDWKITEKNLDTPGQANISLTGETSLTSGEVELVFIDAKVPDTATYGDSGLVQIESLSLNGGSIAGVGDVAVEQVAYLGDASGNGSHNGLDASLMAHFSVGVNSGFDAYRAIDPLLIGDINSDGNISSLDAGLVARQASGGSSHLIPN
ncbi:MAG: cohesin domain-containing protein, partial [Xenococcaceae cyanobacterium MO_188.B29]|nr:cohesin domain-containing protein [Xenococcaceae cyanobacterium MO_188.B29]